MDNEKNSKKRTASPSSTSPPSASKKIQTKLDLRKQGAAPATIVCAPPEKAEVFILIDGYYGEHADMTEETMRRATETVRLIIERVFKLDWTCVVFLSLASSWMKAVPMRLLQQGFGTRLEFYLPCPECQDKTFNNELGYQFKLGQSTTLNKSLDLMQTRLAETTRGDIVIQHPSVHMRSLVTQGIAKLNFTDSFKDAQRRASRTAHYVIHLPHRRAKESEQREFHFFGGNSFQALYQHPEHRVRVDVEEFITQEPQAVVAALERGIK